mmetsp:Transcript_8688/g.25973  ORF Transcript_8688/g.25973 Transcript_8688/m.25973 type:complete len:203 (-) Transcript_8688:27-635(-)
MLCMWLRTSRLHSASHVLTTRADKSQEKLKHTSELCFHGYAPCGSTLSHMANPCQGGRREAERELLSFLILSLASRGICAKTFSCSAVGRCMLRCTARCRSWCALIRTSLPITSMAPPSPPSCLSSTSSASSTRSSLKHACSSLSSEARETRAPVARAAASCSAARGRKGPPARERARTAGLRSCKSSVCARSRTCNSILIN